MFEFRWVLPSTPKPHEVVLQVHARNSWFGAKVLRLDGQPIYRRFVLAGIDHVFAHPDDANVNVELRMVRDAVSAGWTPRLSCNGQEFDELTGVRPPRIVKAPPHLAMVTGLTYLMMFMAGVMLPSILTILEAMWGESGAWPRPGYQPGYDVLAWGVPLGLTAVCLLGFWNMRRWGVKALGGFTAAEMIAILAFGVPLSWVPVAWQVVLLGFGAASYKRMH